MNVCFVNSTRKWGGVKSWTIDLAHGLLLRGHDVLVVARPGVFLEKCRERGLACAAATFGMDFNPIQIVQFCRLLTVRDVDLVVVNVGKDMRTAGIAAAMLGIPVIHRIGLAGDMENTFKVRLLHKWVSPALLAPCEQIKAGLLRKLPFVASGEVTVVQTGKEPTTALPQTSNRPLRLVSTSQLNQDKGHADMLRALAILQNQGHVFEYHVAGTGKIEQELHALTTTLGLDNCVTWHGFLKDVRQLVRSCDIFALPSHVEGLPNALLEAMAEGLVCIARDVGGVSEAWPTETSRFLLPRLAGPDDFANVLSVLHSMTEAQFMSERHLFWEHAKTNGLANMIDAFERLARQLCPGSPGKEQTQRSADFSNKL